MRNTLSHVSLIIFVCIIVLYGCPRLLAIQVAITHNKSFSLNNYRGNILILLLGRDDCPGTAMTTIALDRYILTKPKQISIVRLNVPLRNENLIPSSKWNHSFPCFVDKGRKIADKLDFFYYPTLYVYDKQGNKRYVGAFDKDKIDTMVREILAEKPGDMKKIYTLPMSAVGKYAPSFLVLH